MWYLLQTMSGKEQKVHNCLSEKGFNIFLPRIITHKDRDKKDVIKALFPGYLFLNAETEETLSLVRYGRLGALRYG